MLAISEVDGNFISSDKPSSSFMIFGNNLFVRQTPQSLSPSFKETLLDFDKFSHILSFFAFLVLSPQS